MNVTVIALGVVVIVLLYFLFKMFYKQVAGIDKKYLKDGSTSIDKSKINNNKSTRYNYSTWVYVNTWDNFEKTLIKKSDNTSTEFRLYLDSLSPTLKCSIATSSASEPVIQITDNFPVQKWVYVIVSVDNQIVDCYLDGKLVLSKKLTGTLSTPLDSNITLGQDTNKPDIYLVSPKREPTPMDPQTAWNNYLMGNGMGTTNSNIKMSYLQDNVEKKYISIPV
jgi:hypothetical protein